MDDQLGSGLSDLGADRTSADGRGREIPWAPLLVGLGAGLVGWAVLLLLGLVGSVAVGVGLLVLLGGLTAVALRRRSVRLGWANAITLARLVGLGWIVALTVMLIISGGGQSSQRQIVVIVVVAAVALVLDGVDGRVARARAEASAFGARFDMETDAAMIMVLCLAVGAQGSVGWWVTIIGLARYAYWLCSLAVPALNLPVAPSVLRKTVAVAQAVALLLCLVIGATALGPPWLPSAIAALALAGLTWSFASVTILQLRAAR